MEFPDRVTRAERALLALLLLPVLAAAWLEWRSPFAGAARRGEPWACWLALRPANTALPQLFLALYRPRERKLELVHVPDATPLDGKKTLAKAAALAPEDAAARLMAEEAARLLSSGGPESLAAALAPGRLHVQGDGAWDAEPPVMAKRLARRLWREAIETDLGPFEQVRLALEIRKMGEDDIRAAYLPETKEERLSYFERLLGPAPSDQPLEPTVEVLNSTEKKGVAQGVTKVLRLKGADVMSTGNAPARARTLVYDRTGRPELAAQVRRMLGCRSAETVTQIDAKRLVDVSVVVAGDCLEQR